jgi:hypothetical protein
MRFAFVAIIVLSSVTNAGELEDLYYKQALQRRAGARQTDGSARKAELRERRRNINARSFKREGNTSPVRIDRGTGRAKVHANSNETTSHGRDADAVSEIGIEHLSGFGGPEYTFVVNRDGIFRYNGVRNVERIGRFAGRIPRESLKSLAQLIIKSEYILLHDYYSTATTDVGATITSVVIEGRRYLVMNRNMSDAPDKLMTIESRIDGLLEEAEWETESELRTDEPKHTALDT